MKNVLSSFFGRVRGFADGEPLIALFLGAALLAVFLSALRRSSLPPESDARPGLLWTLYGHFTRVLWASLAVAFLIGTVSVMRGYLHQTVANFQRTHGRVTQANYNAVQSIWGAEQTQGELKVEIFTDEEVTERIESEDLTKPAFLRRKTVRKFATGNPFVAARHEVILRQNPRKKGSALYGGYETDCRFFWKLKNPVSTPKQCNLIFPLPADGAMYDAMTATLNGVDILPQVEIKEGTLILRRNVQPDETMDLSIGFKSRGMSFWYFQVRETREIRDFTLTLSLPDLPKARLNYPEGCMTPTDIKPTADNQGSVLTYRLDHALSNKGMGIALPQLPQPGETTNAVLTEIERAWLLIFAMLALSLTLATERHTVLLTVLFGAATAFTYGLLGDFSDLLFGFWGTASLILLPLFLSLAWLLKRIVANAGKMLAALLLLFGIAYPCAAGLAGQWQTLFLNVCALVLLAFTAKLLARNLSFPLPKG